MTPKTLRLPAIALSLLAWFATPARSEEPGSLPADNWVPLAISGEKANPVPELPEPIPLETAFPENETPPPLPAEPLQPELQLKSPPITIEGDDEDEDLFGRPYNAPGWSSRPEKNDMTWRSGSNGRFGEFSFSNISVHPLKTWEGLSIFNGYRIHFLDGPSQTDMPARLYDFQAGLHYFNEVMDGAWLDMQFSAGLYTDFEDSVREGWRFPSHAVFSWELAPGVQPVVGAKYYARDNLNVLPVAGVILQPDEGFRAELLFPAPKVAVRAYAGGDKEHWISLSGRIGGNQWAIERVPSGLADVATYNSYQLVLGLDTIDKTYTISSLEIGYSFERDLQYRSGFGNFEPSETIFIRLVTTR